MAAHRAVELAVRSSYGRLVAVLSARSRDVAAAEDALGEALAAALVQWPEIGVPANPEGWLVTAGTRRLSDARRRVAVRDAATDDITYAASLANVDARHTAGEPTGFPDRRIDLLFACAHPAVDVGIRTPLMLQVVLGLDAAVIASAFLTPPATMAQRLVRAKRKLRDAGIPIEVPADDARVERLGAVLDAIYAAFGAGWDAVTGSDAAATDLADEAIWLGRLVAEAMPGEAEAQGLLALMLYCHARRDARRDETGAYVPLAMQTPDRWSMAEIGEAERVLRRAARLEAPGRYQLEAAIQSAHLAPAFGRDAPTIGALVNRAAACAEAYGAESGLAACLAIPNDVARSYQPWWALHAHLLARTGRITEARDAYEHAAGLTQSPAVRAFLLTRREMLAS
jgi:RNA polymerase sigma-70 factor (ECF subfamily)